MTSYMQVFNGLNCVQHEYKNQRICFGAAQCEKLITRK